MLSMVTTISTRLEDMPSYLLDLDAQYAPLMAQTPVLPGQTITKPGISTHILQLHQDLLVVCSVQQGIAQRRDWSIKLLKSSYVFGTA